MPALLELLELLRAVRAALVGFDPALHSGEACASVAEELASVEKACAAARARAALRAAECGAHRARGFSGAVEWLARTSGSSPGEARSALEVAAGLERCAAVRSAAASGELSLRQAGIIARTEADVPGAEVELVALAGRGDLASLEDEARRRRLGAADPEELHARQHRARSLRHWLDAEGMVRLAVALPPTAGVALVNRLEAETDRRRRAARRRGTAEAREAHRADALVALVAGKGEATAGRVDLVVVCDLSAWRRGHAHPTELCHVVGGGPVPVARVRELAEDAFLKAVLHDGVAISTVAHFGRHIPAELRTALELGPAPAFEGTRCAEEGCGRRYGLEWDHVDPVANGGLTSFDNLRPRCWPHHRDKTERDRQAGLLGDGPPPRAPP